MRRASHRLDRRQFVAGAVALPVAGLVIPAGGGRVARSDRARVGLVGCGGRGTGAALHAAATGGVVITCMADAFADQIESSVAVLESRAAAAFACPPERRFAGLSAWRHVVEADVDLVILATPPAFRPAHAAAAVRSGRHVWCETPGAVDEAGVRLLASATAEAASRGLSFVSGLGRRHDPATARLVERIRSGAWGRPLSALVRADLGLPWFRPARPEWTAGESALRNWISHARYSGGHFVERHVAAIDMALHALGDVDPVAALPDVRPGTVRYLLADGRHVDAALRRRHGAPGHVEELVVCTGGLRDVRRPADAPHGDGDPLRSAMTALVESIRAGRRVDDGPWICRATLAAIIGRDALAAGRAVAWPGSPGGPPFPARPLQSVHS